MANIFHCLVSVLVLVLVLVSSATACDRCLHQSKAAFFSKASALSCNHNPSYVSPSVSSFLKLQFLAIFLITQMNFEHELTGEFSDKMTSDSLDIVSGSWGLWVWLLGYGFQQWTACGCCFYSLQGWCRLRCLL